MEEKEEYDFHKFYELKLKKSKFKTKGLCGLINLGNKCFMNSILQCLSNTLQLSDYILSGESKEDVNKKSKVVHVYNSYSTLLYNIWEMNQVIKPKTFIESISSIHKKYFKCSQQDSYECFLYILDILHKSLNYTIDVNISGTEKTPRDVLLKQSMIIWQKFYENDYSVIIDMFYGLFCSQSTCIKCNFNEVNFEPYNSICLPIPDDTSNVYNCLDNYCKIENVLDWKCEKCGGDCCKKETNLWTIPNYFVINLKRFNDYGKSKNNNQVNYPLKDLDLSKYISQLKEDPNTYLYDLYAVNFHSGDLNSGHYWSCCKNLDGYWYKYNDGNVSRCSDNAFQEQLVTKNAYILFYQRKFIK